MRNSNVKENYTISLVQVPQTIQSKKQKRHSQSLYLPTDAQESYFKRMLKFTLKQLLHVSVQSPSSGRVKFELPKIVVVNKIS
jgi:hypothetical protein